MNKGYIYKRRLLKLADFLAALPPKRFDYSTWVGDDFEGKQDLSCGTVACAMGHACTIPSFRKAGLYLHVDKSSCLNQILGSPAFKNKKFSTTDPWKAGREMFGLNSQEFNYLFVPDLAYELPEYNLYDILSDRATAKQVSKHIRKFVKAKYG